VAETEVMPEPLYRRIRAFVVAARDRVGYYPVDIDSFVGLVAVEVVNCHAVASAYPPMDRGAARSSRGFLASIQRRLGRPAKVEDFVQALGRKGIEVPEEIAAVLTEAVDVGG
jgi:hypothetical protein